MTAGVQQKRLKIKVNRSGSVTLVVQYLGYGRRGWASRIEREQRITFTKRQFLAALREADVTVTAFEIASQR